jgi:hypothetical protein
MQEPANGIDHSLWINRMRDELSFATHMLFIVRVAHEHDTCVTPNVVADHARKGRPIELALSEIQLGHQHADPGITFDSIESVQRVVESGRLVSGRSHGLEKHFESVRFLMNYQHGCRHEDPRRFLFDTKPAQLVPFSLPMSMQSGATTGISLLVRMHRR